MSERPRFFRWYRSVPLLFLGLVVAVSLGWVRGQGPILRRWVYPVWHQDQLIDSCARHGVDPLLACAIIKCESGWNDAAVSDAGAVGLMQLMPSTSDELAAQGVVDAWAYDPQNLTDPATNIEYGCAYLGQLSRLLSSTDEVIAAYNAGPGAVTDWLRGGSTIEEAIDFPETALYLARVKRAYSQYERLYDSTLSER